MTTARAAPLTRTALVAAGLRVIAIARNVRANTPVADEREEHMQRVATRPLTSAMAVVKTDGDGGFPDSSAASVWDSTERMLVSS
jgi:hypothetical protein